MICILCLVVILVAVVASAMVRRPVSWKNRNHLLLDRINLLVILKRLLDIIQFHFIWVETKLNLDHFCMIHSTERLNPVLLHILLEPITIVKREEKWLQSYRHKLSY